MRDEEFDARQALLDRKCTQGEQTVTQYANALKRAVRDIPGVSDKELILWFLNGLRTGIAHYCKCDTKGKPWTQYENLVDHARAKESELNSRKVLHGDKVVHGDTPGKAKSSRYGKTWQKTGGNISLAVAHNEPQASKGPWREVAPASLKKARFHSPPPPPGRGTPEGRTSASGAGGAGNSGQGDLPRKDWDKELPGSPHEKCGRYSWLSNEQARWCGKKGLCFYCFKSRNDCPKTSTCTGRPVALALLEVRKDAPKWDP